MEIFLMEMIIIMLNGIAQHSVKTKNRANMEQDSCQNKHFTTFCILSVIILVSIVKGKQLKNENIGMCLYHEITSVFVPEAFLKHIVTKGGGAMQKVK